MLPWKFVNSTLSLLLLLSIHSLAQPFVPVYPSIADGPVHWLDFDNDGDQDFVTMLNRDYPQVPALFSNENNSFIEVVGALVPQTGEIEVMDYENDGDDDIIIYDQINNVCKLYKNVNGVFTAQPLYINCKNVKWIDFDSDGDVDLVSSSLDGISFMENIDGIFSYQSKLNMSVEFWDVGDFNSDGLADLVIVRQENYDHIAHIYLHNSDDSFTLDPNNIFPTGLYNVFVRSLDYDQDGDDDILLEGTVKAVQEWHKFMYRNDNNLFAVDSDPFFEKSYPVNADEDPFLEFVTSSNGALEYYNRMPGGSFEKIENQMLTDIYDLFSISYSDNAQENSFVAVYGQINPNVHGTLLYQIQGGKPVHIYHNPLDRVYDAQNLTFVDFDNDGWKDIYLGSTSYAGPQLLRNTKTGFESIGRLSTTFNGYGQWVDFDFDGKMDLIRTADREIWKTSGFSSDITNLTSEKIIDDVFPDSHFTVIDFDKDNDQDILVEDYMEGMYVNDNGLLNLSILFDASFRVLGKSGWGDFDRDGDQDLIMYVDGSSNEKLHYFKNNGNNFEDVPGIIFPSLYGAEPYVADFNLDGYPDLFYLGSTYNNTTVGLYYNDKGTFQSMNTDVFASLKTGSLYSHHIQIIDFDVDGYPDICFMGDTRDSRTVITRLYRNNKGTFEIFNGHGLPELYGAVFHWDDMDKDGDPDLLLSGYDNYIVTQLYRNDVIDVTGPIPNSFEPMPETQLSYNDGYTLSITYTDRIVKGTGSIKIYSQASNTLLYEIDIQSERVLISENKLTLSILNNPFNNHEEVYILVDEGILTDQSGNHSNAISDPDTWVLTISNTKQDQTILFSIIPELLLEDSPFALQASSSSGLPVTFISSNPAIAEIIDDSQLKLFEAGDVSITAYQTGNDLYNTATPVTRQFTIKTITGIDPTYLSENYIYPNPATSWITIDLISLQSSDPVTMSIYDVYGKIVLERTLDNQKTVVSVEDLKPGLYVVLLHQGAETKRHTFIKM